MQTIYTRHIESLRMTGVHVRRLAFRDQFNVEFVKVPVLRVNDAPNTVVFFNLARAGSDVDFHCSK